MIGMIGYFHRVALCCLLLGNIGCESDSRLHPDPKTGNQLKIVVYYSTTDNQQGYSAAKTAEEAAQEVASETLTAYNVKLEPRDDADNMVDASERARKIQIDPSILAVVGHSRSGTTLAALRYYASAGIPVLMPSATSPYVPYNFKLDAPWPDVRPDGKIIGADRFPRVFRLPPKDVPDQVNKIATTALSLLPRKSDGMSKEVMLVCDVTKGSDIYAKPICDALLHHKKLAPHISSYRKFDLDTGDIYGIVTEIHAVKSKHIIVIAYPQIARALLQEIKERGKDAPEKIEQYTFIFSDACMTAAHDLLGFGAQVFITSPSQSLGDEMSEATQILMKHVTNKKATLTEECYTFDALLLIVEALKSQSCKEGINRGCIAEFLENEKSVSAGCREYHFFEGESAITSYRVFTGKNGKLVEVTPLEKKYNRAAR